MLNIYISQCDIILDLKKGVKNDPKMQHLKKYKIILFYFDPIPILFQYISWLNVLLPTYKYTPVPLDFD